MDCRTCDWYLCGRCVPESNILHRALIACLTDADVEPAVRRAVMTMHHHSPDAAEAKNLDYLRAKLRESAYSREMNKYQVDYLERKHYKMLDMGGHPTVLFGEMSLGTLQFLFAKLNNAELQAWYNQSSYQELREIARARRISITNAEQKNGARLAGAPGERGSLLAAESETACRGSHIMGPPPVLGCQ